MSQGDWPIAGKFSRLLIGFTRFHINPLFLRKGGGNWEGGDLHLIIQWIKRKGSKVKPVSRRLGIKVVNEK